MDRFILNDTAYKVVGLDPISNPGIITIQMESTEKSSKDDLVNKIANKQSPTLPDDKVI